MRTLDEIEKEVHESGYQYNLERIPRAGEWYAQVWRDEWAIKEFYQDRNPVMAFEKALDLAKKRHAGENK